MEYVALILDMGFIFNFRACLLGVNIREQSYMHESSSFVIEHNFDQVPIFFMTGNVKRRVCLILD